MDCGLLGPPLRILAYNWRDLAHPRAGGAEVYLQSVAREWVKRGHEVTVFSAAVPGKPAEELVDGVRVIRRGGRIGVYRKARRYWRRDGAGQYDLVLDCVNTRPFLCPRFVRDVPVVALIHQVAREVWRYETPWPVALVGRYLLEPFWLRSYRDVPVVTVSESSRESLAEYGLRRVTVVPEGWVPTAPAPVEKEPVPTVVFVGRLSANKRPEQAIAAFGLARRELPDAQMWVIGSGPEEARLRKLAGPGVTFLGHVPEEVKRERLGRAHALVATSVREGWGLVVTEAAANGTVAIGYDVAGLRDSIGASGGVLTRPDPVSMAAGLVELLPSVADGRRARGQGGRRSPVGGGRRRDPRRPAGGPAAGHGNGGRDGLPPRGVPLRGAGRLPARVSHAAPLFRTADSALRLFGRGSRAMKPPALAVIIPARNEAPRIGGCLDSVHQALGHAGLTDAEVIVVDDESTDQTSEVARAHGALALRQARRQGPLAAWSRGVADSSASVLCFVDADCRVGQGAFAAIARGFARPAVGVVAARSELDSTRTGNSLVERSAAFSALMLHEIKKRLDNHEFMPIGRLMAVRREAWQEGDHRWPCDLVVASRAKQAGWEITYRPDAVVYYQPVGTYKELQSDYVRTIVGQALLGGDLVKPLPRSSRSECRRCQPAPPAAECDRLARQPGAPADRPVTGAAVPGGRLRPLGPASGQSAAPRSRRTRTASR